MLAATWARTSQSVDWALDFTAGEVVVDGGSIWDLHRTIGLDLRDKETNINKMVAAPPTYGHRRDTGDHGCGEAPRPNDELTLQTMRLCKQGLGGRTCSPGWLWTARRGRLLTKSSPRSQIRVISDEREQTNSLNSDLLLMLNSSQMIKKARRSSSNSPRAPIWLQSMAAYVATATDSGDVGMIQRDRERLRGQRSVRVPRQGS
jgi:hypothetical protein